MTKKRIDEVFFLLFCEKNSDGTKHLRLLGRELYQRVGKRLEPEDMLELSNFLTKYPEVKSVDLAYNNIGDYGIEILAENYFSQANNLEYLNVMHCDINVRGMMLLSEANYLNLKELRLVGNKLGNYGARYIGRFIENCTSLETLHIGETDQTLESIESLLIVIEKSSLRSVDISRIIPQTFYSSYSDSILADDLAVLLKLNDTLEVLQVQKCEFDGHDVELLLSGLKVHRNLYMLDLSANRIGDHGVNLLSTWLRTRPLLIALNISSNDIGTRGAQSLALDLPFSRLRLLDLHNNRIGDQGISDIIDTLKKSVQIRMLFIWGNVLRHRSLSKLDRAIKAGVLNQECVDVRVYAADGKLEAAYYSTNRYVQMFYSVSSYGFPPELKIIKNQIAAPDAKPRALIDLDFIDRYPPVDETLTSQEKNDISNMDLEREHSNNKCV
ncbi:ribonuclease inhibitor-like [Sitophilus oryzae]|uniref:Ribonuclease inhibitor-like n=1 Tax=Sitophilus oryzae TaxID=7048 RepID=A0A6J2XRP7_SITOR|nr:ribonuclease inhibitor-like [Sitophilus oryzae]